MCVFKKESENVLRRPRGKFVQSKKLTTSVFALSTSSLYIHEHNIGGAYSLSTSSPIFMNTTEEVFEVCHVQKQKVSTSTLNTSSSGLNLCSQQRCLTFLNGQICVSEHLLWSCMSHKIRGV